jgi:ribonuclease-3
VAITRVVKPSLPISALNGLESLGVPAGGGPIYEIALTHRSYAFERQEPLEHNERLEFLGDAVLGVVVTDLIYRRCPHLTEGDKARLRAAVVNTAALAELATELGLGEHIRLGKGEEATGGRAKPSLLADTLEAVIGAVYLDRGIDGATSALTPLLERAVDKIISSGEVYDAKTALQEIAVRVTGAVPDYRVASSGPDHDKRFVAHVYLQSESYGTGTGRSKKEAEQFAARAAWDRLQGSDGDARVG